METRPFELYAAPPIDLEIKYGHKKISKGGKTYPSKLRHFIVVSRERDNVNFKIAKDVHNSLGDPKPKTIPIRLLSDNPVENFSLFRGMFSKTGELGCGAPYGSDTALRRFRGKGKDFKMVEPFEVKCSKDCPFWKNGKCDISGILYFRLDKSLPRSGALGALRVNGTHAQRRMRASLDILYNETRGILANLPLEVNIHFENKRAQDGKTYPIPMVSVGPRSGVDLNEALQHELSMRRNISDIMGHGEIQIRGVLSSINSREAIMDNSKEDSESLDSAELTEAESEIVELSEKIQSLLDAHPDRKQEIILNKFTDSDLVVDEQGLEAYLLKEQERSKKPPSKDDFEF